MRLTVFRSTFAQGLLAAVVVAAAFATLPPAAGAASTAVLWQRVSGTPPVSKGAGKQRAIAIARGHVRGYRLDRAGMAATLATAPPETMRRSGPLELELPAPGGAFRRFAIRESPVMEPELARRYPQITTYRGTGVDDPTATIRLDLTPLGFHASVRGAAGAWYVDPYYERDQSVYVSYYGRDVTDNRGTFIEREPVQGRAAAPLAQALTPGAPVTERTYRLALVSEKSYADAFGALDADVLDAKTTLMNRVNQIYEDELAIHMNLVAGSDTLNLAGDAATKSNGPCGPTPCYSATEINKCIGETLDRNPFVVNTLIGAANYDIGHLVMAKDGGGIAGLGVVGSDGKAEGCTALPNPVGDQFAVDYVAHEMGHQFGANHPFNGTQANCSGGNRNRSTSVEPGSGSSIMAYAGICGRDNLQPHSDPYFSQRSFAEISSFTGSPQGDGTNQGTAVVPGNRSPIVTSPATHSIPTRTPFALIGSATDPDGDPLTYMWEQNDAGGASGIALTSNTKTNGPLFRQFGTAAVIAPADAALSPSPGENGASPNPTRVFPDMAQILLGNTNAATGTCSAPPSTPTAALPQPVVDCYSEFLPTAAYTNPAMHFRLTARDGRGGVAGADTQLNVVGTAGPFRITAPAGRETLEIGTPVQIQWSVAGTDLPPIGVGNVKISLSSDGGLTFPTDLAPSTPNDGSETVTVPDIPTSAARLKIEPVGNVFFDVSAADLTVEHGPVVTHNVGETAAPVQYSDEISPAPTISATDADGPGSALTATAAGLPAGLALTPAAPSADAERPGRRSWSITGRATGRPGAYLAMVTVTDGAAGEGTTGVPLVVTPEDATATYTGDSEVTQGTRLSARVSESADGSPGDLRTATVTFVERGRTICGPVAADAAGNASCTADFGPGPHNVDALVGGSYTGAATAGRLRARNPVLCTASLALTSARRSGRTVALAGYAERRLAGRRVTLLAGTRAAGHATVRADGTFAAKVRAPRGRRAARTAYRARIGTARSAPLATARALTVTRRGSTVRGRLSGARHGARKLTITRATRCGRGQTVARARTSRSGRFGFAVAATEPGTTAVYRVRATGRPRAASLPIVILG